MTHHAVPLSLPQMFVKATWFEREALGMHEASNPKAWVTPSQQAPKTFATIDTVTLDCFSLQKSFISIFLACDFLLLA